MINSCVAEDIRRTVVIGTSSSTAIEIPPICLKPDSASRSTLTNLVANCSRIHTQYIRLSFTLLGLATGILLTSQPSLFKTLVAEAGKRVLD